MAQPSFRGSLRCLVQLHRYHSLQHSCVKQCRRKMSRPEVSKRSFVTTGSNNNDDSGDKRILGRSTIFLQDGHEINEIPIIIRRMGPHEILFQNELYGGVQIEQLTKGDENFRKRLSRCTTVKGIFKLLDVPDGEVTPYSAAFALQRLCPLQKGSEGGINSFINKAILNELCLTAISGITSLSNDTVINLVRCCCLASGSDGFPKVFYTDVDNEVERRIGDNTWKVHEICEILELVLNCTGSDRELIQNLWIHLGNRYREVNETNIALIYSLFKYVDPDKKKYLFKLMDLQFLKCWWKLNPADVVSISQSVTMCNHVNLNVTRRIGQWVYINLHDVKTEGMKQFLALYSHIISNDEHFIRALERFFIAKSNKLDTSLVMMAMDYLRQIRHLSPKIFDIAASHFVQNSTLYSPLQMFYVVRPFGYLNYMPKNEIAFFGEVEKILEEKFDFLEPYLMIELLQTFVFLEIIPVNFFRRVFNPTFFFKLKNSRFWKSKEGKDKTAHMLWLLFAAWRIDKEHMKFIFRNTELMHRNTIYNRHSCTSRQIGSALASLFEQGGFSEGYRVRTTPHVIDFKILLNDEGHALFSKSKCHTRIAILKTRRTDFCSNIPHMIGELPVKKRHLEKLGFHVVNPQVFGEGKLGVEKMKMELSRWINFDELNGSRVPLVEEGPRAQLGDDEKDLKDLLGSEEEETHLKEGEDNQKLLVKRLVENIDLESERKELTDDDDDDDDDFV